MVKKKTLKGITISVTMPVQLENSLQEEADKLGLSRSRHITNILLDRQQDMEIKAFDDQKEEAKSKRPNRCDHLSDDGKCSFYDLTCSASQVAAETCEGYYEDN